MKYRDVFEAFLSEDAGCDNAVEVEKQDDMFDFMENWFVHIKVVKTGSFEAEVPVSLGITKIFLFITKYDVRAKTT